MRPLSRYSKSSGLTLVEAIIVVVVLIGLLVLIVPMLSRTQSSAPARACLDKIRNIPVAMRTYSSAWGGWTHPDPDYYIKLGGYKLSYEDGYDTARQWDASDFKCPIDPNPDRKHKIGTSYFVIPVFLGINIMKIERPANSGVVARENAGRHPLPDRKGELGIHVTFADASAALMSLENWQELRSGERSPR